MNKIKKEKIIKRVYEEGREITISPCKKKIAVAKNEKKTIAAKQLKKNSNVKSNTQALVEKRPFVENYDLPSCYGKTNLALLVKDPFWLYAYWEIESGAVNAALEKFSREEKEGAKIILRVYDVTLIEFNGQNANCYFDIELTPNANNWYINVWRDKVSYAAEIGLRTINCKFLALVRSNCVQSPPYSNSSRSEQIWMKVTDDVPQSVFVKPPEKISKTESVSYGNISGAGIKQKKGGINITEEDIKKYYADLSFSLRDIISTRLNKLHNGMAGNDSFIIEGETKEERQNIFSNFFPRDYFVRRFSLGSSEEPVVLNKEKSEEAFGGASEFAAGKINPRNFFFELDTELIVYGRTEPDAEGWLDGRKITLRDDGTFSLRFALPDGKLPLRFTAVSNDKKEVRKINTFVQRNTDKEG
ncbi:MAG: DUF4912 domain-containing protein [Candidatus Omnitrophota bacterium]